MSLQEYVNIMADNYVTVDLEQERMETAFKVIDKNGDGQISLQEFNNMFSKDEVDKLFKEVDTKGKGFIDYNGGCLDDSFTLNFRCILFC